MPVPTSAAEQSPYPIEAADSSAVSSDGVLQASPNAVFHLVHSPDNWEIGEVVEGGKTVEYWLPEVRECRVVPGVNLCRTLRRGEDPSEAYLGQVQWLQKRGDIVVPMDAIVGETRGYVRRTPCQDPITRTAGHYHFDAWASPKPSRPGRAPKFWRDTAAYNAWRLTLVRHGWARPDGTTGRLPDPDPDALAARIERARYHLARKEAETGLPERAYQHEVDARIATVERATGAKVPRYVGPYQAPKAAKQ